MTRSLQMGVLAAALAGCATLAVAPTVAEARDKPPACAALSFRPVAAGAPDGTQDTGMYKSRFGKIEIKAEVQGGAAKNYIMMLNGKKVEPSDKAPKASEACLKSKHVEMPYKTQAAGACTGDRFRVVIDRSAAKPVAMFFGLHGAAWDYCSGGTL